MPRRAPRTCSRPGCFKTAIGPYCESHEGYGVEASRQYEARRAQTSGRQLYQDPRWQKERVQFLSAFPQCCELDCTASSAVVDHHIPHRGDPTLFWNRTNWRPMCKSHHDRKTATEDGGFGNRAPSAA